VLFELLLVACGAKIPNRGTSRWEELGQGPQASVRGEDFLETNAADGGVEVSHLNTGSLIKYCLGLHVRFVRKQLSLAVFPRQVPRDCTTFCNDVRMSDADWVCEPRAYTKENKVVILN
jgi:hypothetical protein